MYSLVFGNHKRVELVCDSLASISFCKWGFAYIIGQSVDLRTYLGAGNNGLNSILPHIGMCLQVAS